MILLNVVHPPAGGNPVIVIIGSVSYDYIIFPIISGCLIIILLASFNTFSPSYFPFTEPSAEVDIGYRIESNKIIIFCCIRKK